MADNTAGQTRVGSNDQVTGGFAAGKITYDSTTITATDYIRVDRCRRGCRQDRLQDSPERHSGRYSRQQGLLLARLRLNANLRAA